MLEPIWNDKPETASRVRSRIENVLDWAKTSGHRGGENPARWKGHLQNLLSSHKEVRVKHFAALPYREISAFISDLRQQDGDVGARALDFLVLTAARSGEVLKARWTEIDPVERVWTIPAERMKTRKEHRVPLSDFAWAIVEQQQAIRSSDSAQG